jgi:hypothetical protein
VRLDAEPPVCATILARDGGPLLDLQLKCVELLAEPSVRGAWFGVVAKRAVFLLDLVGDVLRAEGGEPRVVLDDERVPAAVAADPAAPAVGDAVEEGDQCVGMFTRVVRRVDRVQDALRVDPDVPELLKRCLYVVVGRIAAAFPPA